MTVHVPASRDREAEGGRTHGTVGKEYTAQTFMSQALFARRWKHMVRERQPLGQTWSQVPRRERQGTAPLSLYLHHQHSKLFLDGIRAFEAEDRTRERPKPLFMKLSAPDVQSPLIIRRCPHQKRLRMLVHVPARKDTFSKSLVFSLPKTFHPSIMGNP
jgi:hypothetical protein